MSGKKFKKLINEMVKDSDIIVMSKDGEGNSYSPLSDISDDFNYAAESTWCGEIGFRKLTSDLIKLGYGEGDVKKGKKAIVLFPTN